MSTLEDVLTASRARPGAVHMTELDDVDGPIYTSPDDEVGPGYVVLRQVVALLAGGQFIALDSASARRLAAELVSGADQAEAVAS